MKQFELFIILLLMGSGGSMKTITYHSLSIDDKAGSGDQHEVLANYREKKIKAICSASSGMLTTYAHCLVFVDEKLAAKFDW